MKLPVISGKDAVKAFGKLGYVTVRQTGSHIRMKHQSDGSKNPLSIPNHKVIGKGLLRKLLRDAEITIEDLYDLL
ncbi:MAG: type II toxin-antitoxin system HicA family toxin [Candidatus Methanoperedens sp.]|nr:type II toxin-antitoxin system HicA family toxin [Candidatus Methanoperedens sp.]